jgi:sec-independent protein translocase protein TatB
MLNVGFGEILLIAALALVVVGPERLPKLLRTAGQYYARLRRSAQELQMAFMDEGDLLDGRTSDRYGGQPRSVQSRSRSVESPETVNPPVVLPPPALEPPVAGAPTAEPASTAEPPPSGSDGQP